MTNAFVAKEKNNIRYFEILNNKYEKEMKFNPMSLQHNNNVSFTSINLQNLCHLP